MNINDPSQLFGQLHPSDQRGKAIIERRLGRKRSKSLVHTTELTQLLRHSAKQQDISFSVPCFSGEPLLLNFNKSHAIYAQIPCMPHAWSLQTIFAHLEEMSLTAPTYVLTNGDIWTLMWVLDVPITKHEFYKFHLFQNALRQKLIKNSPPEDSLEITNLIPLVGTLNTKKNGELGLVTLVSTTSNVLSKDKAEQFFNRTTHPSERLRLTNLSMFITELIAIFTYRALTISSEVDTHQLWLDFFAIGLKDFCSESQLRKELVAVEQAITGCRSGVSTMNIDSSIKKASGGYLDISSQRHKYSNESTFKLIAEQLDVTQLEIDHLGLRLLTGLHSASTMSLTENLMAFGDSDFVPLRRLFIQSVA